MSVTVWQFPPVSYPAYMSSWDDPRSTSFGLSGTPHASQSKHDRRIMNIMAHGIGPDRMGGGYIEALKRLQLGKLPLVRALILPAHWFGATCGLQDQRGSYELEWKDEDTEMLWLSGDDDLIWTTGREITVTSVYERNGFWAVEAAGFPANTIIAAPSERVLADTGAVAYTLQPAKSDATGAARLIVDADMTGASTLKVGAPESAAFHINKWPTSQQAANTAHTYDFSMTEVFVDEFEGGFVEVDPWN